MAGAPERDELAWERSG